MFEFFTENKLISHNQSRFRPRHSCINQLLHITTMFMNHSMMALETRGIFLDISKAFDEVQHEGLPFKLKQYGISGNLLTVINEFLYQRKQRVILIGQHLSWTNVEAGVPQRPILQISNEQGLQIQNYLQMTPLCSLLFKI